MHKIHEARWWLTWLVLPHLGCSSANFRPSDRAKAWLTETEVFVQDNYPERKLLMEAQDFQSSAIEEFLQQPVPLDIQIVIDNSASMAEEQNGLADKIEPLLSAISDSDWRINVITTDANDPQCSRAMIQKGDPLAGSKFQEAITAGTDGSGLERGILRAVQGIECDNNWLRSDSVLAVLIISDEDNCSLNGAYACQDNVDELTGQLLINRLMSTRTLGETARVYGIVFGENDPLNECRGNNNVATRFYTEVIERTQGVRGKICSNDYTSTLTSISQDLSSLLKDQFALAVEPHPDSLRVYLDGEPYEEFTVESRFVSLANRLGQGQTVTIDYTFGDKSAWKYIEIAREPDPSSIQIIIDGVPLGEDDFSFQSDSMFWVEIDRGIAMGSQLEMSYLERIPLKNTFPLKKRDIKNAIVTVDGEKATFWEAKSNGTVVFEQAPPAGSHIEISYKYID